MQILTVIDEGEAYLVNGFTYVPKSSQTWVRKLVDQWIIAGNVPALPAPELPEASQQRLTLAVQRHMDTVAGERNYDNIISCCTYATSSNPKFSAEGQSAVAWRDAVWVKCYEILDACMAGQRAIPTEAELLAELPTIQWPEGV